MKKYILFFLIIIVTFYCLFNEKKIKLKYYETIECDFYGDTEVKPWWWVISHENSNCNSIYPPDFDYSCINLSDVDFDKYNVVLSQGREINKLVYIKSDIFPFLPLNNAGRAYLSKNYYNNQVFIYLIDKNNKVKFDLKNNYEDNYVIDEKK